MMNYSNSTKDNFECPGDSDIVRTVKVMSIMLLAGFGVFGNVLVIVIAVKYTRQTNIHHLIISMAVADTLVILLYTIQNAPSLINNDTWLILPNFAISRNFCKVGKALEYVSKTVNMLTLVIISIERYRATRVTALRLRPYTKRQKACTVTCSWGFCTAFSIFLFFVAELHLRNGIYICIFMENTILYEVGGIIICTIFTFSFFFIVLLSILTSLRLRRPSVVQANLSDIQRQVRAKRISNAVRMVVCSILIYGCCFSPTFFWFAYSFEISISGYSFEIFGLGCNFFPLVFVSDFLMLLNSCLGPYVFIMFLPDFREATKRLLFYKQRDVHQTSLELNTINETQRNNNQLSREK